MAVVVVGAGAAGLVAARRLADAGWPCLVLEAADEVGGRLATRRVGPARLDSGAQFFTVRSAEMAALVDGWLAAGVVYEWCRGFGPPPDGHPRYAGRDGMAGLARHLAGGIDVRTGTAVRTVRPSGDGWAVDDLEAEAVVLTPPVPLSRAVLAFDADVPDVGYEPTLAALAVLDRPAALPPPGAVQLDGPLRFVADNRAKGVSAASAVTVHAGGRWSAAHWDDPDDDALAALLDLARPWLGAAAVTGAVLDRWPHATPRTTVADRCVVAARAPAGPVVLAGDAFAGPKVEGAVLSGLAAAAAVIAAGDF